MQTTQQGSTRPSENDSPCNTTVTSHTEKKEIPAHICGSAFEKLWVQQQIFTIDKSRIQRFLGWITQNEMQEIEKGVVSSLALAEITS